MHSLDCGNFGATIVDIRHSDSTIKAGPETLFGGASCQLWKKRETDDSRKEKYKQRTIIDTSQT